MNFGKHPFIKDYTGEKIPWFEPAPWCDGDWGSLKALHDSWRLGRRLARIVRQMQAAKETIHDEILEALRDVKRDCAARLLAWQPTPRQRERAN